MSDARRVIFLTGATGTVGGALVPRLLRDPAAELVLLVRGRDAADAAGRVRALHAWWGIEGDAALTGRLRVLQGDISAPAFGLGEAGFADLAARATHLIHCAASVKLTMSPEEATATAVTPTRTMLALARLVADAGRLAKVDFVSTVGVWGRTPGVMPERLLPEVDRFHNTYEAAKSEAERVIASEGAGLPLTIHRPSMVIGDTGTGRVMHFQVFYHLCEFLSGGRTFGVMPDLGRTRLDVIPADWVASAIDWASRAGAAAPPVLHLCAGPEGAVPLVELQQEVRERWRAAGVALPALKRVPRAWLERAVPLIGLVAGAKARRALRALPPVLAYLAEDQGFANPRSAALLAAAGLPVPAREQYLGPSIDWYLARRRAR